MTNFNEKVISMESFSVTTDGSGNADITLTRTPAADDAIMLFCQNAARHAEFVSRSGTVVTILVRKLAYDKPDQTHNQPKNLPSGVTAQSTKQVTGGSSSSSGAGSGGPASLHGHNHYVSYEHTHSHEITSFSSTACPVAASEADLIIVVFYAEA